MKTLKDYSSMLTASIVDQYVKFLDRLSQIQGCLTDRGQISQIKPDEGGLDIGVNLLDVCNHGLNLILVATSKNNFFGLSCRKGDCRFTADSTLAGPSDQDYMCEW